MSGARYYVVRSKDGETLRTGCVSGLQYPQMKPQFPAPPDRNLMSIDGSIWSECFYYKVDPPFVLGEGESVSFE